MVANTSASRVTSFANCITNIRIKDKLNMEITFAFIAWASFHTCINSTCINFIEDTISITNNSTLAFFNF